MIGGPVIRCLSTCARRDPPELAGAKDSSAVASRKLPAAPGLAQKKSAPPLRETRLFAIAAAFAYSFVTRIVLCTIPLLKRRKYVPAASPPVAIVAVP